MKGILIFFVSLCVLAGALFAQDPRGGITGSVVDSSGAVIPGVRIRATNNETGVSVPATSSQAGTFTIPYLLPGFYRVNAELTGFKSFVRDKVEVRVSEMVDLTIPMEVGEVTETVEVSAESPMLETASSSLGQVMDQRRISELPQRGANPLELALLTPGVVNATNLRLRKAMAPEATSQIAADGAGTYNNEFQIDGISNVSADRGSGYGRVAFSPPQSAVREFKMQTSAYDASVGNTMGALLNVSTASGTNEYHGEGHYFLRHSALDAPNFFANKNNQTQPVYQDHRYGGSIGGPLIIPKLYNGRNRTFWFYTAEQNPFGVPVQFTRTVPTAAQRQGDFSALLAVNPTTYQIYDPLTTTPAANGRFQRQAFAGNIIPQNRLDPTGLALVNLYPLPNVPGTNDGRNNFFIAGKAFQDYYVHLVRLDHAFSDTHRAFLRLHYDMWREQKNNDFGTWINGIHQNRPNRGVAVDDVIVLNQSTVLNVRYGLTSTKWWQYRVTRGVRSGQPWLLGQPASLPRSGTVSDSADFGWRLLPDLLVGESWRRRELQPHPHVPGQRESPAGASQHQDRFRFPRLPQLQQPAADRRGAGSHLRDGVHPRAVGHRRRGANWPGSGIDAAWHPGRRDGGGCQFGAAAQVLGPLRSRRCARHPQTHREHWPPL
jgi:hypothetical protein